MQIDIEEVDNEIGIAIGYLYTGERAVKIFIPEFEYDNLVRDGFFIRDGKQKDSAGVLNTTEEYIKQNSKI